MNTKSLSAIAVFVSLLIGVAFVNAGCNKDSSPTISEPAGQYGSGTITATSSAGSLSITGTGAWPIQAGSSVLAVYDTSVGSGVFFVYGYQQVSGPNYNVIVLVAFMPTKVDTGTHSPPWQSQVGVAYNVDTSLHADSLAYAAVSGTIIVSSVSGSNVMGTYSVMARKGTGQAIPFTGTFNVTYVVGVMPEKQPAGRGQLWPSPLRDASRRLLQLR